MFFQDFSSRHIRMIKFITKIALFASIFVCKATDETSDFWRMEKSLEYHYNMAKKDILRAGGKVVDQPIRLVFVESIRVESVIAVAYGMNNDANINITVSKEWWDKLGVYERRWVMMHELLHDTYNFKHESCMFLTTKLNRISKKKYAKAMEDLEKKFKTIHNG